MFRVSGFRGSTVRLVGFGFKFSVDSEVLLLGFFRF